MDTKRRLLLGFGLGLLAMLTCLGVPAVLWLLGGGTPNVAVDYVARLNEAAAAVPEDDRAWPVYERVLTSADWDDALLRASERLRDRDPGGEGWDEAMAVMDERAELLGLAREAAAMPSLGLVVSASSTPGATPGGATAPPWVVNVLLPHLQQFRSLARLLGADAYAAAWAGDGERFVADIEAMYGVAGHAGEHRTLINQLVEVAIRAFAADKIRTALERSPGLLSDAQLARLDGVLSAQDGGEPYRLDMTGERLYFEDTVQRFFTDDGNGDGHITVDGVSLLGSLSGSRSMTLPAGASRLGIGAARMFSSGRAEVVDQYDEWLGRIEVWADEPLWERGPLGIEAEAQRLDATRRFDVGMKLLTLLMPAIEKAAASVEALNCDEDATRLVIAVERYRVRHGDWPPDLDALEADGLGPIPTDPFDGGPMRYALTGSGPAVYSIGTDRDDDGGAHADRAKRWLPAEVARARAAADPQYDGDWVFWPTDE